MDDLCTFEKQDREPQFKTWVYQKSGWRAKIRDMSASKTSNYIQIMINMPHPSQEPSATSKAPNKDLQDIDILCNFKIKI